jgi:acetyl-CoA carboxylase carboxyl transferase alpha subunit
MGEELFADVASMDFLGFDFPGTNYTKMLAEQQAKTGKLCGVECFVRDVDGVKAVWLRHDFGFFGGSLGCAEGEKITRGFEHAIANSLPVVVECKSGGARMQEGTLSLMQMAKVSVAVEALHDAGLPFISVLADPTYGGVSASYALQGDVKIGVTPKARIGFAGPAVILNTVFGMDQAEYDKNCPQGFQSADWLKDQGQLDIVVDTVEDLCPTVASCLRVLLKTKGPVGEVAAAPEVPLDYTPDFTKSRHIRRPQAQDIISTVFDGFVEMLGDGKQQKDICMQGGLAFFRGAPVVVMGTCKGHTPDDMASRNHGMPAPSGYRTAMRLMQLAERFGLPVVTLIDTVGAYPSFQSEAEGQSEAIATNLVVMAGLKVPIVSVVIGEGGSGGALAIAMGDRIGMLANAYYGVISPEGAASILGRYKDDEHKAQQLPKDCVTLATTQQIYAPNLKALGVIDEIIMEEEGEDYENFPNLAARIGAFVDASLTDLTGKSDTELRKSRFDKFRAMGKFANSTEEERAAVAEAHKNAKPRPKRERKPEPEILQKELEFVANQTINSANSTYRGKAPAGNILVPAPLVETEASPAPNAKSVLDSEGPEALAKWVGEQKTVLVTDTTMRDAHQSLLATRFRTADLVKSGPEFSARMGQPGCFSLECWGGATFDVAFRFLHEDAWERLRKLRKAIPNVCFQMLIRGANAVGYTSYPDNVVKKFCHLAAKNGMDVFRIFDCFNQLNCMQNCIDAVREANKVAEVCICYTGDFTTSEVYTLDYYKELAASIEAAGAHMIGLKDMAGLMKPQLVRPFVEAVRSVTTIPLHYHGHNTSSANLAVIIEMTACGVDVVDACLASMADGTSQPSINAFLASTQGTPRDAGIPFMALENLDRYYGLLRELYEPFESGMKSGTARVFDNEIPGGQYSNLYVQCKSMDLYDRWFEVLNMYRDVNMMLGNVVKVTPSSKVVGDFALFLIAQDLTCDDVKKVGDTLDYPDSVVALFNGDLGYPHKGFPQWLSKMVLKGSEPIRKGGEADKLPALDFDAKTTEVSALLGRDATEEDVMTAILYPKVYSDYVKFTNQYGCLEQMPSPQYWYGMKVGDSMTVSVDGSDVDVKCTRISALLPSGEREVTFSLAGGEIRKKIKDEAAAGPDAFTGQMADPSNASHLASPMSGVVDTIFVKEGQSVAEGDPIATISAMKMEVKVVAQAASVIKSIEVAEGDKVIGGALIGVMN